MVAPWYPRSGVKRKGWMGDENYFRRPKGRGHRTRREGDEIACSCGKRWPVGEVHP